MIDEMTMKEARELAKLYPLELCGCGAVTLGGSDVIFINEESTFPRHNCETVNN